MKTVHEFYSETQTKQNMQFGADADINMAKKWWNSDACNVNQWNLYNTTPDTDIKWSQYPSSLYISNNMS